MKLAKWLTENLFGWLKKKMAKLVRLVGMLLRKGVRCYRSNQKDRI